MTFSSLLISTATVTRLNEDGYDDYGNIVQDWVVEHDDVPCRVDYRGGNENIEDRNTVTLTAIIFIGADVTVLHLDRITVDSVVWEVSDAPTLRQNGTGPHHYEVPVEKVTV